MALSPGGRLVAHAQVPSTHSAAEGVARGVVEALEHVLRQGSIEPSAVSLVAFSTTQATNALLEGDTAVVGILGIGSGPAVPLAEHQTRLGDVRLAPGLTLRTFHRFIDATDGLPAGAVEKSASALVSEGASVLVVSAAFAADEPELEVQAAALAAASGVPATAASSLSGLHGLRQRTRTAVLNASILSVMLRTAEMTEAGVRRIGIGAPVHVMRSDGGVMSLTEVRARPILTILSGPAAGVAAASQHARISDGIFLEVGGTSTDVSVIRDGRARAGPASVGGHRLNVRALDITTLGIAGGSVPLLDGGRIRAVGPRSAHIAAYRYACFCDPEELRQAKVGPATGPMRLEAGDGRGPITVTPTCVANLLGRYAPGDWGYGNARSVEAALAAFGLEPLAAAKRIEALSTRTVVRTLERLVAEHALDREAIALAGGGGGATAIVPAVAEAIGLPHRVVEYAPVVSAIGTALAMLRETLERSVPSPAERDLLAIRREAWERLAAMGARPDTIEVEVEVEPSRNLLRATASGSTGAQAPPAATASPEALERALAAEFPASSSRPQLACSTGPLRVYVASRERTSLFGLVRWTEPLVRVFDERGVARLKKRGAAWLARRKRELAAELAGFLGAQATYGDSGREAPEVQLLIGSRILDLGGVAREEQIAALIHAEVADCSEEETVVVIASRR